MLPFAHRPPRSLLSIMTLMPGFTHSSAGAGSSRWLHSPERCERNSIGPPGSRSSIIRLIRSARRFVEQRMMSRPGSHGRPTVRFRSARVRDDGLPSRRSSNAALNRGSDWRCTPSSITPVQQPLVHDRADGLGLEEPGPLPLAAGPEHSGLGAAHVYDGRQLGEVAGENHLHAAEREPRFAGAFEEPVEAVHEVGARHAHLVQHDRVQRPERVRVVMVSAFIHAGVYASDGPGGTRYASPGPGMRAVCIR